MGKTMSPGGMSSPFHEMDVYGKTFEIMSLSSIPEWAIWCKEDIPNALYASARISVEMNSDEVPSFEAALRWNLEDAREGESFFLEEREPRAAFRRVAFMLMEEKIPENLGVKALERRTEKFVSELRETDEMPRLKNKEKGNGCGIRGSRTLRHGKEARGERRMR